MNLTNCPKCLIAGRFNERWDSYYCVKCDDWLEAHCEDKECFHCHNRPAYPSDTYEEEDDFEEVYD